VVDIGAKLPGGVKTQVTRHKTQDTRPKAKATRSKARVQHLDHLELETCILGLELLVPGIGAKLPEAGDLGQGYRPGQYQVIQPRTWPPPFDQQQHEPEHDKAQPNQAH
jgi:hypothetical protein